MRRRVAAAVLALCAPAAVAWRPAGSWVMSAGRPSRTVALTREAGNNAKLEKLLVAKGIDCVEVPCIAFKEGPDAAALPGHLATGAYDYIIVTSPEAAKVFLAGWERAAAPPPQLRVACVGVATGDALRARGIEPAFTPSKATGEVLAAELPVPADCSTEHSAGDGSGSARVPPRVLYPASARAPGTVQAGLEARGFVVVRLDTYDTGDAEWGAEEADAAARAAVATFGSPSAVKAWTKRRGVGDVVAACIGETSAAACRAAGWPEARIVYPDKPGIAGWAQAVVEALERVPQQA